MLKAFSARFGVESLSEKRVLMQMSSHVTDKAGGSQYSFKRKSQMQSVSLASLKLCCRIQSFLEREKLVCFVLVTP